jgi:hypothetical protein
MEHQRPVTNDRLSAAQEMPDPRGRPRRRLVSRLVAERIRFKDDDVGIRPHRERALPPGAAARGREHTGWEQARASEELGNAQRALPDQTPKGAGESSCGTWVREGARRQRPCQIGSAAAPGQRYRVAGHHGVLVDQGRPDQRRVRRLRLVEEVHAAAAPRIGRIAGLSALHETHAAAQSPPSTVLPDLDPLLTTTTVWIAQTVPAGDREVRVDTFDHRSNRTGHIIIDTQTGRLDRYDPLSKRTDTGPIIPPPAPGSQLPARLRLDTRAIR